MIRVPRCCCQKRRRQKDPSKKNYLGSLFCFNVSSEYLLVYFSALIEEKKSLSLIFNQKSKIFFEKGNNVPDLIQSLSPFSEKAGVEQQKKDFSKGDSMLTPAAERGGIGDASFLLRLPLPSPPTQNSPLRAKTMIVRSWGGGEREVRVCRSRRRRRRPVVHELLQQQQQ